VTGRRLFHTVVARGLALTAVLEAGAACSAHHHPHREGPPPMPPGPCEGAACSLHGHVTDASGAPVAGATVGVEGVGYMPIPTTTTREDGSYEIALPGSVVRNPWVVVQLPDGTEKRAQATVGPGPNALDVQLDPPLSPP
jgi:hypothetical protein